MDFLRTSMPSSLVDKARIKGAGALEDHELPPASGAPVRVRPAALSLSLSLSRPCSAAAAWQLSLALSVSLARFLSLCFSR